MGKILVTGSKGQLGSELQAIAHNYQTNFYFHDIDTLDITNQKDVEALFNSIKPEWLINCAAYTAVDKAESEIEKAHLINEDAVKILVDNCQTHNTKLIHISTDYVFDGKQHRPYIETDTTNPVSVYGKSKLEGEKIVLQYPLGMIIRTAWLYSVYGNNFVKTMLRLGKEKNELRVVFDQVGTPTNAADLAEAVLEIIQKIESKSYHFLPGIYHFSNEGATSWYDFSSEIMQQSRLTCKVFPIETKDYPTPATRPPYSVFNKNKIKSTYNISISWWKDSLSKCLTQIHS